LPLSSEVVRYWPSAYRQPAHAADPPAWVRGGYRPASLEAAGPAALWAGLARKP